MASVLLNFSNIFENFEAFESFSSDFEGPCINDNFGSINFD